MTNLEFVSRVSLFSEADWAELDAAASRQQVGGYLWDLAWDSALKAGGAEPAAIAGATCPESASARARAAVQGTAAALAVPDALKPAVRDALVSPCWSLIPELRPIRPARARFRSHSLMRPCPQLATVRQWLLAA